MKGTPYTYEDFCIGCGGGLPGFAYRDIGIVVLSEPLPTSVVDDYAVLPTPELVDSLVRGTSVDLVGYGVSQQLRRRSARLDRTARAPVCSDPTCRSEFRARRRVHPP